MAKVPHYWIAEDMADSFIEWLSKQDEITPVEPMRGEFTPERARLRFRDSRLGFEQTVMVYDSSKYRCCNIPRNLLTALATYCSEAGVEMPTGSLGTARGDGRSDAELAAERAERESARKTAKTKAKGKVGVAKGKSAKAA
jgi:hypothetical protein